MAWRVVFRLGRRKHATHETFLIFATRERLDDELLKLGAPESTVRRPGLVGDIPSSPELLEFRNETGELVAFLRETYRGYKIEELSIERATKARALRSRKLRVPLTEANPVET